MNIAPHQHCACERMSNNLSLCVDSLTFREEGKQVRLVPRRDEQATAVVLDGCVFQDDRLKCDGLFLWRGRTKKAAILVELKGANHIAHAFEQLAYVRRERPEYQELLAILEAFPGGVPNQLAIIISNGMLSRPEHERLEKAYGIRVRAVLYCEPSSAIPNVREHL
jgi:hypothetical protein